MKKEENKLVKHEDDNKTPCKLIIKFSNHETLMHEIKIMIKIDKKL